MTLSRDNIPPGWIWLGVGLLSAAVLFALLMLMRGCALYLAARSMS